ncbi:metabolite traffic protein EboE [Pilimelia columellifera]|uniref:Metabolite traffic protein EboE n=1 Tax=Pilimelia columellifera subsp. columellifera TaxID=706583 RepID=A0ABN3NTH8_9ACTN
MRLHHSDGTAVHLGYCTNVHPAEDLGGIVDQLDTYGVGVRDRLGVDSLGLGLWLPAPVAAELAADPVALRRFRAELDARGLEVVTLNGFPYQAFQAPVVKHAVYHPDWTRPERLRYTLDLAHILAALLPADAARGSISTLPLAWRDPWDAGRAQQCARALDDLAEGLARVERSTGRAIRVGIEPEPGCVVETIEQAVTQLASVDHDRIGICLDLAHLACAWEDPTRSLDALAQAGLSVVKVQVSAALASRDPVADAQRLREYVEPRFLHQTRGSAGFAADDLDQALAEPSREEWRVHYHVPLHADPPPPLHSTVDVLRDGLRAVLAGPSARCDHLDVETYTWEVLPPQRRPRTSSDLVDGIAAELAFARQEILALGLTDTAEEQR